MLSAIPAIAQVAVPAPAQSSGVPSSSSVDATLPDAPGEAHTPVDAVVAAQASFKTSGDGVPTCNAMLSMHIISFKPDATTGVRKPCSELIYPYQRFLSTDVVIPMTWQQKGYLAIHDVTDLANLGTIVGISALTIGIDSHTAYGPGLKGFGKIAGVSLSQDVTGQFFGAFAIPTLVHQDPRYYRMPQASIHRRIFYSISRTFVSRHDDGSTMPNYATLLTYPISAEIANLYVPGIHSDASSTIARIATGIATDPVNNLITEFLPDVAKRVHVRIIFVQSILNNLSNGTNGLTLQ
jgi:hypothetical protein